MSDAQYRRLQRLYKASPTEETLFALNTYEVRQGTAVLPTGWQEYRELIDEQGHAAQPLLVAALLEQYPTSEEDNNSIYHLAHAFARVADSTTIPLLLKVVDYLDEHDNYYRTQAKNYECAIRWIEIKEQYNIPHDTSLWDIVTRCPLLDHIEIFPSNSRGSPSVSMYGVWGPLKEQGYYTGSLYREHDIWRTSVPGYGGAEYSVTAGIRNTLYMLVRAKCYGRFPMSRDPLPRERWADDIALVIAERAVELLKEEVPTNPCVYNFLFDECAER